jgi:hypothetical protein
LRYTVAIFVAALIALAGVASGQDSARGADSVRVLLSVSGDSTMVPLVRESLSAGLEALERVTLVEEGHTHELEVVAQKSLDRRGRQVGVALSIVVLVPFEPYEEEVVGMIEKGLGSEVVDDYCGLTEGLCWVGDQWVRTAGPDDLEWVSGKVAGDFAERYLRPRPESGSEEGEGPGG